MRQRQTSAGEILTSIMLTVFRVNASLLAKGNQLVGPLSITSARWQVLGAIALSPRPIPAPQIAAMMGVTRQGVQKQINLALLDGMVEALPNPRHERSPNYALTQHGQQTFEAVMVLQRKWADALTDGVSHDDLKRTLRLLTTLDERLALTPLPTQTPLRRSRTAKALSGSPHC